MRNAQAWQQAVVERSANWPQHLATYLVSAMAQVRRQFPSEQRLDARSASLTAAMAHGDEGRKSDYARRLERLTRGNGPFQAYAETVVALFREVPTPAHWGADMQATNLHPQGATARTRTFGAVGSHWSFAGAKLLSSWRDLADRVSVLSMA